MERTSVSIILSSDRVLSGEKSGKAGERAQAMCEEFSASVRAVEVVPEGAEPVESALKAALCAGSDVIVIIGGTGLGRTNFTPEVTQKYISVRLHGVETQVLLRGLESSAKAGLSRGIIGMTEHGGGSLVVNTASSVGAVEDTLGVVLPLLPDIFRSCR